MKTLILTNSDALSAPTIKKMVGNSSVEGVGILKKNRPQIEPVLKSIGLKEDQILALERRNWVSELSQFIRKNEIEVVWVLTFPWIIPNELFNTVPKGFINFHFGMLPKYKGADPIFWQLKNNEEIGGVTIHLMNDKIDEGPVLMREELRIIPGENYGLHCKRLGEFTSTLTEKLIEKLSNNQNNYLNLDSEVETYESKPSIEDLTIYWNKQTAEEIECLINATNPKYSGANTKLAGFEMRILEVTPVTMQGAIQAEPGQIVHADVVYGLVVACINNEFLRITIAQTGEGFLSGVKLFNLGFLTGHQFTN